MNTQRVGIQAAVVLLLLAAAFIGMRALRAPASAREAKAAEASSGVGGEAPVDARPQDIRRIQPAERPAPEGAVAFPDAPPWAQGGRTDEEVLQNYAPEDLEKAGVTTQSMYYRERALSIVSLLPLAAQSGNEELVNYLRLMGQGFSYAAMPGIESDSKKVLQAQRDMLSRVRKDLGGKLQEPVYENGPTLSDWLKKEETRVEQMAAGKGPSVANALRRAEWDYSHNGDRKIAKDESEPDVKPGERPAPAYDDDDDDDDGNIYAPLSPAVKRALEKQAEEAE